MGNDEKNIAKTIQLKIGVKEKRVKKDKRHGNKRNE